MSVEDRALLIEELLAGGLDADGRARLAEALAGDPSWRQEVLHELQTAHALDALLRGAPAEALIQRVEYLIERRRPERARSTIRAVQQRIASRSRRRTGTVIGISTAVAAGLAVTVGLWVAGTHQRQHEDAPEAPASTPTLAPELTASVTGATTLVRAGEDQPLGDGEAVRAGDRIRLQPTALVALCWSGDGTRLVLAKDADLTVAALGEAGEGKSLSLGAGQLSAAVAHQPAGRPLVIRTPQGSATIIGTRFTLSVDAESTQLQVDEGLVRLQAAGADASVAVAAGERASIDRTGLHQHGPAAATPVAVAAQPPGEWQPLLASGEGWTADRGSWRLADGVAVLEGGAERGGRIVTNRSLGDFELTCRLRAAAGRTYSEIQIRSFSWVLEIHHSVVDPAWKSIHVLAQGDRLEATCDGVPVAFQRTGSPRLSTGSLAFFVGQQQRLEIADLRVRELPAP
jgi:ferric-dicitrate binding protein FerR (iron transport regulator)